MRFKSIGSFCLIVFLLQSCVSETEKKVEKPRILISTDIGGTDDDDFQSMIHFLMYSDLFDTEGLVSSPSYGDGTKQDILDMIDLYEKDLDKLNQSENDQFPAPDALRAICKQGRHGAAPLAGYTTPTEGSDWIIQCAQRQDDRPLWVLVWGGLEDVAQALHDAPDIQDKIRVYWIGGPNKKWSTNSYAYIAENFPDLWFIENNATYRGFFIDEQSTDDLKGKEYYNHYINDMGNMGSDFRNYYKGDIKMGDTPSLLYMMNGDPDDPSGNSWGGSFEKTNYTSKITFDRPTSFEDSVPVYSIVEFHFKGPELRIPQDSACFKFVVQSGMGEQAWDGYYNGNGDFVIRYAPKKAEALEYEITSEISELNGINGQLSVTNIWPGDKNEADYEVGSNWFTDKKDAKLFIGEWQGAKTVADFREEALKDWSKRWARLK